MCTLLYAVTGLSDIASNIGGQKVEYTAGNFVEAAHTRNDETYEARILYVKWGCKHCTSKGLQTSCNASFKITYVHAQVPSLHRNYFRFWKGLLVTALGRDSVPLVHKSSV